MKRTGKLDIFYAMCEDGIYQAVHYPAIAISYNQNGLAPVNELVDPTHPVKIRQYSRPATLMLNRTYHARNWQTVIDYELRLVLRLW